MNKSKPTALRATQTALPRPPIALIANGFATQLVIEAVLAAVKAGLRWVHLRDHEAAPERFQCEAKALAARVRSVHPATTLTVNTRLRTARTLGAGLHTGWRGPRPEAIAAPIPRPLGYSAHHVLELPPARRRVVDYVTYSPIFPTSSKPGHPGTGVDALRRFGRQAGVPVLALGGLTPERVAPCRRAGAAGIAVLSGIVHADNPTQAARAYQQAWKEAG
ncbi:thiamine phosphate synthase [Longimonas halophila]|uniref:Thiamine phosphate synthase n=2 Tax=Longimonas halophila TaxID=1469170 RepID=A0A2H3NPX3_9BACT|nr:thiamine phosphate synthase [Longimonas halophila]